MLRNRRLTLLIEEDFDNSLKRSLKNDSWGRKLRYAVDPAYTTSNSPLPMAASCTLNLTPNAGAITVNDSTGAARKRTMLTFD